VTSRRRAFLPAALWFFLIMVLLSLPGSSFPEVRFWKPDKIAHIGLFGMQALLLWIALAAKRGDAASGPGPTARVNAGSRPSLSPLFTAALWTLLFGALSEYYQDIFTSRLADPYDIVANAIGVAAAVIVVIVLGTERVLSLAHRVLRM
jgi:hypothetical protein